MTQVLDTKSKVGNYLTIRKRSVLMKNQLKWVTLQRQIEKEKYRDSWKHMKKNKIIKIE